MENQVKQEIHISGSGTASGGKYSEVHISGSGKITGDIECEEFSSSGSSRVLGAVKAKYFKISGSGHVNGNIMADEINVSGSSTFEGDVTAVKKMKVSGSSKVEGSLHGGEIGISGSIHVDKDCEADVFKASGGFHIGGLLNAGIVTVSLGGNSNVKEIGGENIEVRVSPNSDSLLLRLIQLVSSITKGTLTTDVIEGDNIFLEHTKCKIVRGNNITIGKGCEIDLVEYKTDLKLEGDGKVKEQKKI